MGKNIRKKIKNASLKNPFKGNQLPYLIKKLLAFSFLYFMQKL